MRYYVIVRGAEEGPWVVCETPDESIAEELAATFIDGVVLAQNQAALDPDFADAVRSWVGDDDRIWRRMRDEADAFDVVEEVWENYLEHLTDDVGTVGDE